MTAPAGRVRVADVCAHELLAGAELHGVDTPSNAPVQTVDLLLPDQVLATPLTRGGLAVLALDAGAAYGGDGEHRAHLVDVVLRRAGTAGSALVVVLGAATPLAEATRALARLLQLPLLVAPAPTASTELVVGLRELVATPHQPVADLLLDVTRRLRRARQRLDDVVRLLGAALPGANVYACAGPELVVVGAPRLTSPKDVVAHLAPGELLGDGYGAAVLPVAGLGGDIAVWLVAERERAGRIWLDAAGAALGLCQGTVLAWLAREQASYDRDARMRSALLAEILEHAQGITRSVTEQAARAEWQLEGWHTGIHFHFTPSAPSALTVRTLAGQLERTGLKPGALVERTDGWSAWLTTQLEPGPDHAREIARRIEADLRHPPAGHEIAVGVGSPQRDVAGIGATLAEARQAALIAATSPRPVSVRVLQEVGPSRLLLGWYSSEAFADYAQELLGPLLDSDEPEVLRTLEAYLERACSASQTARALGVHRNTVAQRVAKAERLLGTTTATADNRLALQLALRVSRTRRP